MGEMDLFSTRERAEEMLIVFRKVIGSYTTKGNTPFSTSKGKRLEIVGLCCNREFLVKCYRKVLDGKGSSKREGILRKGLCPWRKKVRNTLSGRSG